MLNFVDLQAEQWIDKMIKAVEDEQTEVESGGRPYRLGLGAKVGRHSRVGPSNDHVKRKLHDKLNAGKRNVAKSIKESTPPANDDDNEDEDDDFESRSSAFARKRASAVSNQGTLSTGLSLRTRLEFRLPIQMSNIGRRIHMIPSFPVHNLVGEEVTMSTERQQKAGPPQLFASNKALKLDKQWVDKMIKTVENEPAEVESGGRPSRSV
ncbi:hypothetical protein Dsin_026102 [Dipteronia sinensis]|uniref:Uncharacterized protein n=1 Tax=Dipteronia sinensis TaxID=43782 RepID=A0AAE0DXK7_9ROSI|nr:hypothetical protein Dsin_026102 [Dipteronia sinensis]